MILNTTVGFQDSRYHSCLPEYADQMTIIYPKLEQIINTCLKKMGCAICGADLGEDDNKSAGKQPRRTGQYEQNNRKGLQKKQQHGTVCKNEVVLIFQQFLEEVDKNNRILKSRIQRFQSWQDGMMEEGLDKYQPAYQFVFDSITEGYKKIFNTDLDSSNVQMLLEPYIQSCSFFRDSRRIVINIQYFLRSLEQVVVNGQHYPDQEYHKRRNFFHPDELVVVQMIEKLIALCIDPKKRASFRISTEQFSEVNLIAENDDLRKIIAEKDLSTSKLLKDIQKLTNDLVVQESKHNSQLLEGQSYISTLKMSLQEKDKLIQQYQSDLAQKQRQKVAQSNVQVKEVKRFQQNILELKTNSEEKKPASSGDSTLTIQGSFDALAKQAQTQNLQINQLKAKIQAQEVQISQLNGKIRQTQSASQKEKDLLAIKLKKTQLQLDKQLLIVEDLSDLNKELGRQLQELKNSTRYRTNSIFAHKTLFVGDILENNKEEKQYLMRSIENHMQAVISKTKLLYQFKRDASTNFHNMVDNHSNLVVIVETQNHVLLAGYYSGLYTDKLNLDEEALVISLTNSKCFFLNNLKNNPKKDQKDKRSMHGMVYDKFYLIFGNSEIRLKHGQKKIFSNFGVQNGYFFSNGATVNELLCQGRKNQLQIINYQIHEVFFDSEMETIQC